MAFGDELSVRVSANTGSFERGIESARDSLSKFRTGAVATSGSLQLLQGRADEAGDEIGSVGRKASTSSFGLTQLSAASGAANISFQGLETTLVVGLIPTLALLGTTLVPITAALGGLAAIVGSIGLVGFVGVLGAVKTNTQALKEEAQDLLSTVRSEFAPFFDIFAAGLTILIDRLQDTISQIAPTQAEAERLAGSLVQLGTAVIDILPTLTNLALGLAQDFLPPLVRLTRDVLPEVPGFIQGLVDTFRELAPLLSGTGGFLVELTRQLFELGMTVINTVTPAFSGIGASINNGLDAFNSLDSSLQKLGVSVGLLVGPLGVLVSILGGPITLAVVGITAAVVTFREEISALVTTIVSNINPALEALSGFLENIGIERVTDAFNDYIDSLSETFGILKGTALNILNALQQAFTDNEAAITRFGRVATRGISGFIRVLTALRRVANFVFGTIVGPFIVELINLLGSRLGPALNALSGQLTLIFDALSFVANKGGSLWARFGDEITTVARFVGDLLGTLIINNLDLVISTLTALSQLLQGDFGKAADTLISVFERIATRTVEFVEDWGIVETFTEIGSAIVSTISTFITRDIPQLFVLGLGLAIGNVKTLAGSLINAFLVPFNALSKAVTSLFEGIGNSIVDSLNSTIDAFESLINNVINSLPEEIRSRIGFGTVDIDSVGEISTEATTASLRDVDQSQARTQEVRELSVSLGFDVQGSGPLAEFVRQNAEATVQERERRANRNTGGTNGL